MWSFRHPLGRISPGKILRLIVAADATVAWSADNWASTNRMDTTHNSALNVWFADLPTEGCLDGAVIEFTFLWKEAKRSEGRSYSVRVSGPK
jgi:glucoamylase